MLIALDRLVNEGRTRAMLSDSDPLTREFSAMAKSIEAGQYPHPMEIWELSTALREAGASAWADWLHEYLPK